MTNTALTGPALHVTNYVASSAPDLVASTLDTLREYQAIAYKPCTVDAEILPLSAFSPDASRADYLSRECKAHRAQSQRERLRRRS